MTYCSSTQLYVPLNCCSRRLLSDPIFLFGFLFQNADVLKKTKQTKNTTLVNLYLQRKRKKTFSLIPSVVRKTQQNSSLCEFDCKLTTCSKIEVIMLLPGSSVIYRFVYSEEVRFIQLLYPSYCFATAQIQYVSLTELGCLLKKTFK